ncbi:hypothetical protein RI129_007244 [Pyrocoelia pectoralis]|uniref:DDE Tnp4 domain-containing protein n=1 Tax=Pyrocoelia pectoralis TaxID=417401 RepID=A0AAN7VHK1_9COLE
MDEIDVGIGLLILECLLNIKKKKAKRQRRWWVRPIYMSRIRQGHFHNLVQEMRLSDSDSFFQFTRMNYELYEELCRLTHKDLRKKSIRPSIECSQRLMITLRYLATGESFQSLAFNFLHETCKVLWKNLMPTYLNVPSKLEWQEIARDFNRLWNYPNCLGAIDGKHVTIECSQFYNYKKTFSCVLMATCDAHYKFTMVDIGAMGVQSDGGIFAASEIGQRLMNGSLIIPEPQPLPGELEEMPFCFVGDEAFPLKPNLMRPFPGGRQELPLCKKIFNYRLSRARRMIENTFGILVARWRIFLTPIKTSIDNVDGIIQATVTEDIIQKRHSFDKSW